MKWRAAEQHIESKSWHFEKKKNKQDSQPPSQFSSSKRRKDKINKIRAKSGMVTQIPVKFRGSLGNTLKIYIQRINSSHFIDILPPTKIKSRDYKQLKETHNKQ